MTQMVAKTLEFKGVRVVVETTLALDTVLANLRALMGRVSVQEVVALASEVETEAEYIEQVSKRYVGASGFMLFAEIDHGGWLPRFGIKRRSVRWILGNPLIAVTMIRHDITTGLFVPVEILATEIEDSRGTSIIYLRPSSLMMTASNPSLLRAAKALDTKLDALVARATAV